MPKKVKNPNDSEIINNLNFLIDLAKTIKVDYTEDLRKGVIDLKKKELLYLKYAAGPYVRAYVKLILFELKNVDSDIFNFLIKKFPKMQSLEDIDIVLTELMTMKRLYEL